MLLLRIEPTDGPVVELEIAMDLTSEQYARVLRETADAIEKHKDL